MASISVKKSIVTLSVIFFSVILFVAGWYAIARVNTLRAPLTLVSPDEPMAKRAVIKVASYNIAHGRGGRLGEKNWKHETREALFEHLDRIVEQINMEAPDMILLNEVDFTAAWSLNVDQAQYIADGCGYPYVLKQKNMDLSFPFYRFCFGNALLSRYPVKNEQIIEFAPYSKWEDIFVGNHDGFYCELMLPFGTVGVFGIHLEYRSEGTRVAAARVISGLSSHLTIPVVALGDFNSTPGYLPDSETSADGENAMALLLNEAGFVPFLNREITGFSFPSEKPARLIDWIIGKNIKSFSNAKIVNSGLSDHLMIVADVEI